MCCESEKNFSLYTLTILEGDGLGSKLMDGTNSWVDPDLIRSNTLQCSCPATVSAFIDTNTGPFSESLPTRFTCSCKKKNYSFIYMVKLITQIIFPRTQFSLKRMDRVAKLILSVGKKLKYIYSIF